MLEEEIVASLWNFLAFITIAQGKIVEKVIIVVIVE